MVGEPDDGERVHRPLARLEPVDVSERERELDVLARREQPRGPALADDADALAAERRAPVAVEVGEPDAVDDTSPSSGVSSPASSASSVDLPEPDGPVTTVSVPGGKTPSNRSSAASWP